MDFLSRYPNSLGLYWHNIPDQQAGSLARQGRPRERGVMIWSEGSQQSYPRAGNRNQDFDLPGEKRGVLPWLLVEGLTHSRGFWEPLVERYTCTVTQVCPQRPQSQSVSYWWACASGRPAWYPGSGCSTGHLSWSKTGPSSSRYPQGNPPPAGPGRRNSSNHLEGRRMLVFLLFSL